MQIKVLEVNSNLLKPFIVVKNSLMPMLMFEHDDGDVICDFFYVYVIQM